MADSSDIQGFFTQLRQLASDIDSSTGDLRNRIENPPKEEFSSTAVLKLQEKKKDARKLKKEAQDRLSTFQKEGGEFEAVLSACNPLVGFQKKVVVKIEAFLKQYGYVTWGEITAKEDERHQEESQKQKTCTESVQDDVQEPSVKTPPGKVPRSGTGTPKLEDYGLSEYTLHALTSCHNRGAQSAQIRPLDQAQQQSTQSYPGPVSDNWFNSCNAMATKQENRSDNTTGAEQRMEKQHVFKTPPRVAEKPAAYGTPKLEDFGLSDYTMQSLNRYHTGGKPSASQTGFKSHQFSSYPSPQMAIPSPFQHNGIIVTPSIANGRPFSLETPIDKRGGVAGFEAQDSPYQPPGITRGSRNTVKDEEPKLKLQDYFEESMSSTTRSGKDEVYAASHTQLRSARLQNLRCAAQSSNVDGKTPPEPELLSSRLKSLQKANELSKNEGATPPEPELLSSRLTTLLTKTNPTTVDTATPPEPELLISRLTKLRAAANMSSVSNHQLHDTTNSSVSVAGLPKPLSERPYYLSDVPEPPRFLGKYTFGHTNPSQENIPPAYNH